MKTKKYLLGGMILLTIVALPLLFNCSGGPREKKASGALSFTNLRAISLKQLQARLAAGDLEELARAKTFYGLSKLYGFLWNEEERDVVLFGEAVPGKPVLRFDDFVISLRKAYLMYVNGVSGDSVIFYHAGCSIDPDAPSWNRMDEIDYRSKQGDTVSNEDEWMQICGEPQAVRIMGIPGNTHLALVMVKADYFLKEITSGMRRVESVKGFKSMTDLRREQIIEAFKKGKHDYPGSPVNRFEFVAGEAEFENSDHIWLLNRVPVRLVTEAETNTKTELRGTGMADPMALEFTEQFSENFETIASEYPVFDSLAAAYRLYAVAGAIPESNFITDASLFDYLLNSYPIDSVAVPMYLPGKSMVSRVDYKIGETRLSQYLYNCGGVSLKAGFRTSALGRVMGRDLMRNITKARPADAIKWEFSFKKNSWALVVPPFAGYAVFGPPPPGK